MLTTAAALLVLVLLLLVLLALPVLLLVLLALVLQGAAASAVGAAVAGAAAGAVRASARSPRRVAAPARAGGSTPEGDAYHGGRTDDRQTFATAASHMALGVGTTGDSALASHELRSPAGKSTLRARTHGSDCPRRRPRPRRRRIHVRARRP
ncbi:hypothetical protein ACFU6S_11605, partial [Streptomyces sp. NPDC057456]|uniref:hypothetical protein n=1 Tax=Streptomyces sp. NPDC057456 TaxID=3346139 RepID=UPI0036CA75A1